MCRFSFDGSVSIHHVCSVGINLVLVFHRDDRSCVRICTNASTDTFGVTGSHWISTWLYMGHVPMLAGATVPVCMHCTSSAAMVKCADDYGEEMVRSARITGRGRGKEALQVHERT